MTKKIFLGCDGRDRDLAGTRGRFNKAFTLIELLVVIAIIAILAALLFPPWPTPRKGPNKSVACPIFARWGRPCTCMSDDSNDTLPPGSPLSATPYALDDVQSPAYSGTTSTSNFKKYLPYYLATYMGLPGPADIGEGTNTIKAFLCPGYITSLPGVVKGIPGYDIEANNFIRALGYSSTRSITNLPGWPFGKSGASPQVSLKMSAMVSSLDQVWAIADFDLQAVDPSSSLGTMKLDGSFNKSDFVAIVPVHGKIRNFLYFDFHVGTKPVATPNDY